MNDLLILAAMDGTDWLIAVGALVVGAVGGLVGVRLLTGQTLTKARGEADRLVAQAKAEAAATAQRAE
ncbi:MAG TPA: hypothetical protein DEB06_00390, partial [Phycisphaerales bacterium]|nr:hypothetical protein [Phycisphaerales bacterium]